MISIPKAVSRRNPPAGLMVRQVAAKLLSAIIDKKNSFDGLCDHERGHPQYLALSQADQALCRAILQSALRHRAAISTLLAKFLVRPLPQNAHALKHILHIAAAQILYLNVPNHAALYLAVEAAKAAPRCQRFSGLINALLRKISQADPIASQNFSHLPSWFTDFLIKDYGPERAKAIVKAQTKEACLDLSVKSNPALWAQKLNGIVLANGSVRLQPQQRAVHELPGFSEGAWWVQDVAAALPCLLLGDIAGKKVADLCAAPGGKTAQMVAMGGSVTAVDISKNRLKRLENNMKRLGFTVTLYERPLQAFAPPHLFDALLLDVPCSSTGTIRRHPDILWSKDAADIDKLSLLQYTLLSKAFDFLKPGGILVFSNCSLAKQEGEAVVKKLLDQRPDIMLSHVTPDELGDFSSLITPEGYVRTTPADLVLDQPNMSGMDGFFAARLQKQPNASVS